MNRMVHINIWPGNYGLVSDQTSFFILLEEYDPLLSLTPLDTFFVFIFCIFLLHAHAFTEQSSEKKTVVFIPGHHLLARKKSGPVLTQPSWKHQSWVAVWKEWIETGRDGWSTGRATLANVWHHLIHWMAFLCQDTERVGGREAACFRLCLEQTRSLCRHTPPHTSPNCARRQINKPRLTSHTRVPKLKKKKDKMLFWGKKSKSWTD